MIDSGARSSATTTPTERAGRSRRLADPPGATGAGVALAPGLPIVERDARTLQIGVDPGRRVIVRDPPPGTAELLGLLAQGLSLPVARRRTAAVRRVPASSWDGVVADLLAGGFLLPDGSAPEPAWRDAVTVVVGAGPVATTVAALLAAAGTGHVHLDPDRSLRSTDATPAGPSAADIRSATAVVPFERPRTPGARPRPAGASDRAALTAALRRTRPDLAVHRPSGFRPPDLVVLATDGPPPPEVTRPLMVDGRAHLVVGAIDRRGVVGPLVLPGRTSCLHCHDLHRRDADPGWPQVQASLRRAPLPPAPVLAATVAALAVDQALLFLGGDRPTTVDGTLTSVVGDWRVRRRSWRVHRDCFCRLR